MQLDVAILAPSLFCCIEAICCQCVLVGPVSFSVFSWCVGSHFSYVNVAAHLGNCAKGRCVIWCFLNVILTSDKLTHGGGSLTLLGFSCVVSLGILVVFGVYRLVLPSKVLHFFVIVAVPGYCRFPWPGMTLACSCYLCQEVWMHRV